jgi:hypothetical protein
MDTTNPTRSKLRIPNDPMYRLLREGCITEFNVKKASGEKVDLRGCDLRGLDQRAGCRWFGLQRLLFSADRSSQRRLSQRAA